MNMRFASFAFLIMLTAATSCQLTAQSPDYTITLEIEELSNDTVFLANYYGEKMFYADTAISDARGKVVFEGRLYEQCGKFAAVIPGPKFFEFLAVDEDIHIKTKAAQPSAFIEVVESPENEIFYDYLKFLQDKREEAAPLEAVLRDNTESEGDPSAARDSLMAFIKDVAAEQRHIIPAYPDYNLRSAGAVSHTLCAAS